MGEVGLLDSRMLSRHKWGLAEAGEGSVDLDADKIEVVPSMV